MNPAHYKNYNAGADIKPYQIVKITARKLVAPCSGSGDASLGVSQDLGCKSGKPVDIAHGGLPEIRLGANLTEIGVGLTSDANGFAIKAQSGNRVIGYNLAPGKANEVIPFVFAPGVQP